MSLSSRNRFFCGEVLTYTQGSEEIIVEENISDQGSKAGRDVPVDEIGLNPRDWEDNTELEVSLSYPFEIKDTIEHKKNAQELKTSCFCVTSRTTIVTRMQGWR